VFLYDGKQDEQRIDMKMLKATLAIVLSAVIASCAMAPVPAFADNRKFEQATVTRVIDGDTAEITVDLGFEVRLVDHFRFYGIDTPEKKQAGHDEATKALKDLIEGKQVTIDYISKDKYGRRLATIYVVKDGKTISANDYMVQKGYAKSYLGGKKE
jgi:endonuclease YncB( thermonuclease family)